MHSRENSKVPIDRIVKGMELEDVFDKEGKLLLSSVRITDDEQIAALKKQGVLYAYIKESRSSPSPDKWIDDGVGSEVMSEGLGKREECYYKELSKAKEVHRVTLEAARNTLRDVRMGKQISVKPIEQAAEGMVSSIMRNPDALVSLAQIKGYDEYTYVHSVNVGILIISLVHSMGYPPELMLEGGIGGLLHDIGKMRVPEHILNKPGKYTEEEFSIMKKHPENGLIILKNSRSISDFSKIVVIEHHERYDGSGYPKGIRSKEIHEIGLIAAVADVYDAMTTDRIYRSAWTPQKALAMIFQGCDKEYSRRIVELFTKNLGIYPVGSFVRLASGEMGIVTRVDRGALLTPDVLILFNEKGERLEKPVEYRLSELQKTEKRDLYRIEGSLNPADYQVAIKDYLKVGPFE